MEGFRVWLRELFASAGEPVPVPAPSPHPRTDSTSYHPATQSNWSDSYVADDNDSAIALYMQLNKGSGNLCFSPFSIRTALAIAYAGAMSETASQMRTVLRFSSSNGTLHVDFAKVIQRLNEAGGGKYDMSVANSLWVQDGEPLQAEFLDLIARHYGSSVNFVDFRRSAEAARLIINQWVEDITRRKIRELIPAGSLNDDTCLALVNAVYFKGMWELPFRKVETRDEPFLLEGGGNVPAPLMRQQNTIKYLKARGFQMVVLDYVGGDLSMLVLLPDKRDGLRSLQSRLSSQMLHKCLASMGVCEVNLFLPRFKITWGVVNIRDHLEALGMTQAFNQSEADFSGINGHVPPDKEALFISSVFHKAVIDVNEEGTEAAAATAIEITLTASRRASRPPPVPTFRADHPFVYAIRDRKNGTLLFLGHVVDPTRES